jgi:uncharacterized protein (DUF58 family)
MPDPVLRAGSIKSAIALTLAFALGMAGALIARNPAIEFHVAALILFVCAGVVAVFALFAALGAIPRVRMWVRPLSHDFLNTQRALYALALAAAAVAALVSANNLIYLALSCLLAALLASGLTSRLVLAGLELRFSLPDHVFALQPTLARFTIRNLKSWITSFSIRLGVDKHEKSTAVMQFDEIYCPMIRGGSEAVATVDVQFPRRGVYAEEAFYLRTRFPFGFLEKSARLKLSQKILVYPPVTPSPAVESLSRRLNERWQRNAPGDSHDLYRIRPALPEDGARFIDWKSSARAPNLMVREHTRVDEQRVVVIFDRTLPAGADAGARFETAVSLCASLLWKLHWMKAEVRFVSDDFEVTVQPGSSAVYRVLGYLAVVQAASARDARPWAESALAAIGRTQAFQVVFTSAPAAERPALQSSEGHYFSLDRL